MKKIILILALAFGCNIASAQVDVIKKQIGESLRGKILSVDNNVIVFTYEGKNEEFTIARNAVEKITYGRTGKVEQISNKIAVESESDWQKVIIVESLNLTAGLEVGAQIGTGADLANYQSGNGNSSITKNLKMQAAKLGYQFILIANDANAGRTAHVYKY